MEKTAVALNPLEIRSTPPSRTAWLVVLALLLLGAASFLIYRGRQASSIQLDSLPISTEELAADYGLEVRLIGVTAAGGMIDLRLKIVDVEKAQQFLEMPAHLPRLIDVDSGQALMVSEGLDDEIEWTEGGILFNFYPNDNGLIQPGSPVIIQFGDLHLEPIKAQ